MEQKQKNFTPCQSACPRLNTRAKKDGKDFFKLQYCFYVTVVLDYCHHEVQQTIKFYFKILEVTIEIYTNRQTWPGGRMFKTLRLQRVWLTADSLLKIFISMHESIRDALSILGALCLFQRVKVGNQGPYLPEYST